MKAPALSPSLCPPMPSPKDAPLIRPHPTGGFTHAWPVSGTARVYVGHFRTAPEAFRAARGAVNPLLRANLSATHRTQ